MFADSDNSFNIISLPLILDGDDWSLQTSILSDPEYLSFDGLDFLGNLTTRMSPTANIRSMISISSSATMCP